MLSALGFDTLDALSRAAIPGSILRSEALNIPAALPERAALQELNAIVELNRKVRSFVGLGYVPSHLPAVIQRNILENPGFYTQYTPYQAEIAQGRLEALLNFQTLVTSMTGLPLANASLLDEATAAAEAVVLCRGATPTKQPRILVDDGCHPQTVDVVRTRCAALGIEVALACATEQTVRELAPFCVLVQYPHTDGRLIDHRRTITAAHEIGARVALCADLLSLALLVSPAELGADVAVGSTQRLGLPLGFGGPHAAYLACTEDLKRLIPGRIVGVSKDAFGKRAYRLALQTREQHIRRERASSNICTAQVLPAIIASFYAIYHGPSGMKAIVEHCVRGARIVAAGLRRLGLPVAADSLFDTLRVEVDETRKQQIVAVAQTLGIELRTDIQGAICLTIAETTTEQDLTDILRAFAAPKELTFDASELIAVSDAALPATFSRASSYLDQPVFNQYHTEHELLRYIHRLETLDLSLTTSMTPLGSCTMKLNAAAAMIPLTWPLLSQPHPFTAPENTPGYTRITGDLCAWLAEITGLPGVSLQPNAGAQGEYTGLLVIRAYHDSRGQSARRVCLIPTSAHGTNPASATLAGLRVVPVACDARGNVDISDLEAKAQAHADALCCIMVTYPSTHGVFEERIREVCDTVHRFGGLVYLDGANMNAQVGLCRPGDYGADVCHINLHKTFSIPHGGGGPGMGPIAVVERLRPYLPSHHFLPSIGSAIGAVSAAPYGSASVLAISWMYIRLMGATGLRKASQVAILNANYMAKRLEGYYPVLYRNIAGLCAHEFIIDAREFKKSAGIEVDDIAKRLMDYGFHAPTMSFPVPGTLMIEPTESESKAELDRFCDAMISIRGEIKDIEENRSSRTDNPLKNAPHPASAVARDEWPHAYSRAQAAYPSEATRTHKFWPAVGRIDNAAGDRNLICTCDTSSLLT
jgi:glycine dehydrogenase